MSLQPVCIDLPDQALPKKWAWAPLTSLAKLESGHTPRKTVEEYWANGTVPWICLQDIRDAHGKVIYETKFKTTPLGIQNSSARLLPEGTVCFSRDISVGFTTIMGQEMSTTQHFANWVCGPSIYNKYLMQALVASRHSLTKSGEGTVVRTIYMPALERFHVALPPLNEQRRIVARIEELTSRSKTAKEALLAIPPLLEKFRQSVLAAAFRGDLTAEWRRQNPDVEPAEVLLERIRVERRKRWEESGARGKYVEPEPVEVSGLPELPRGWCWSSLGECFGVYVGATPSRKEQSFWGGDIPWVSSGEVQFCVIDSTRERITAEGLSKTSTSLHPVGTVLVGMIGEGKTRGQAAILGIDACNSQNSAAIRVSETEISPSYVYQWLARQYEANRRIGSGNSQQALNKSRVQSIPIPLAPLTEQAELMRLAGLLLDFPEGQQESLHTALKQVLELERSILSKAFRGELVPQDPADEPASTLMERIRAQDPIPKKKNAHH